MKKNKMFALVAAAVAVTTLVASGQNVRWDGAGGDGLWTTASNWFETGTNPKVRYVPTITNNTAHWSSGTIVLDDVGEVERWWQRNVSSPNLLNIVTNGSLTSAGDVALNDFSGSYVYADLQVNGGSMTVSNNLSISGQNDSQGEGRLFLNSGTIDVLDRVKIGTAGKGVGVDGVLTVNDGTLTVDTQTIVGGGNLDTDTAFLNVYGGVYTESFVGSGNSLQIGIGPGSGAVNVYGGMLINNHGLEMDADASNDVGTASINLYGGEFWQLEPTVTIQDESTLSFQEGILYWSSNQLATVTDLVTNEMVSWELGLTNMLTESWDTSWTNSFTLDYGYWSKEYGSVLFADVDDVTNGYTTLWAYNLSPLVQPPVSNGIAETHTFNNGSGDQRWTTAGNWDIGTVPTIEDTVNHTANGDTLVVASEVEAADLFISHNNTARVAVVEYGSLYVTNYIEVGNSGGQSAAGILQVDGGDVTFGGDAVFGRFGTDRKGFCELNAGSITANGTTTFGGGNPATGTLTINGGTFTQNGPVLKLGNTGNGTLNMNGGTLNIPGGAGQWFPLQLGQGPNGGDGIINLNGGSIYTDKVALETNGADDGVGVLYLNAGLFEITSGNDQGLSMGDDGLVVIDQGLLRWKGEGNAGQITNRVAQSQITWTNGMNTMVYDTWDFAFANGTSTLYVEATNGYTTVWAYTPPPPEELPELSIATDAGSVDVTAINLDVLKGYELMGTDSLVFTNWVGLGTTSGVSEATWNIPATEAVQFFQVEEQSP